MTTIVKATTKGQITLPAKWRNKFDTNQFILSYGENIINIRPIEFVRILKSKNKKQRLTLKQVLKKEGKSKEWKEPIFNADRDNNGNGVNANDFLKILKEVDG